jgi:ribosomal protein S18 acetylase RimI-like enzyme
MTTITVRAATIDDTASIAVLNAEVQALHATALPDLFKPADGAALASAVAAMIAGSRNLVWLAEVGDEPAGYAYAELIQRTETSHRYAEDMIYLHHLAVAAAHRRRGVGTALMAALNAHASQHAITRVGLDVWTFNESARAFFRRQGFMPYNERLWNR